MSKERGAGLGRLKKTKRKIKALGSDLKTLKKNVGIRIKRSVTLIPRAREPISRHRNLKTLKKTERRGRIPKRTGGLEILKRTDLEVQSLRSLFAQEQNQLTKAQGYGPRQQLIKAQEGVPQQR